MKKILILTLIAMLSVSCGNNYDSKIKNAIKDIHGKYVELDYTSRLELSIDHSTGTLLKQKEELQSLIWRIDKIVGKINSGEITIPLPHNTGVKYIYEWETTDILVTVESKFNQLRIENRQTFEPGATKVTIIHK